MTAGDKIFLYNYSQPNSNLLDNGKIKKPFCSFLTKMTVLNIRIEQIHELQIAFYEFTISQL